MDTFLKYISDHGLIDEHQDMKGRTMYDFHNYKKRLPSIEKELSNKKVIINLDANADILFDVKLSRDIMESHNFTDSFIRDFYKNYTKILSAIRGITFKDDFIPYVESKNYGGWHGVNAIAASGEIANHFGLPQSIVRDLLIWYILEGTGQMFFDMADADFTSSFDSVNYPNMERFKQALLTFFTKFMGFRERDIAVMAYNKIID